LKIANIKFSQIILSSTKFFKIFVLNGDNSPIIWIFKNWVIDSWLRLQLLKLFIQRFCIFIILGLRDDSFRDTWESFIFYHHGKRNSYFSFISCQLQDVIIIFNFLLRLFDLVTRNNRSFVLKGSNFVQLIKKVFNCDSL
jgi:hypothetical protein